MTQPQGAPLGSQDPVPGMVPPEPILGNASDLIAGLSAEGWHAHDWVLGAGFLGSSEHIREWPGKPRDRCSDLF